jgi:hypothetical protein
MKRVCKIYSGEEAQYLVTHWLQGASASEIGADLGVTRSAVCGWLHRHPLTAGQQAERTAAVAARPRPSALEQAGRLKARRARYRASHPAPRPPSAKASTPVPAPQHRIWNLKPPPMTPKEQLRREFEQAWINTAALGRRHGNHTV